MYAQALNFIQLTKPSIMLLILVAGATSLVIESSLLTDPLKLGLFLLSLFLTGGSANALNQYFEREIDSQMTRTSARRPLPLHKIPPSQALTFSVSIGITGILLLGFIFNWLTASLAMGTILFYGLFYTLFLKPNTSQNIVIGGIAGAMAPVGAWTAAAGKMALFPWLLFLIIFFWTPPHFWSLALRFEDDYRKTKLPMLPVVKGDEAAFNWIYRYSIILLLISLLPLTINFGWIYLAVSVIMGAIFMEKVYKAKKHQSHDLAWGVFKFSILYLFALFAALILDKLI